MNKKELEYMKKDDTGNYDIDGVSYDGSEVQVSGDKTDGNLSKDGDSVQKKIEDNPTEAPTEFDRQKNLDAETGVPDSGNQ